MIALIILTYENAEATRQCVESIVLHNKADVKYIIVDNGSSETDRSSLINSMEKIFGNDLKITDNENISNPGLCTLLLLDKNVGYAQGNNAGLQIAYADKEVDAVMILNNDILFVEDIVGGLYQQMKATEDCAIISPVLYRKDLTEYDYACARLNPTIGSLIRHNMLHYVRRLTKVNKFDIDRQNYLLLNTDQRAGLLQIELPSGSCMLVDKDFLKSIDSFDPNTFLYSEENILYKKIAKTGRHNYISLDYKCVHLGASTTASMPNNEWLVRQAKNSELYYVRKYSGASPTVILMHKLSVKFYMFTYKLQKSLKAKCSKK